jgi:hypothetical protein
VDGGAADEGPRTLERVLNTVGDTWFEKDRTKLAEYAAKKGPE